MYLLPRPARSRFFHRLVIAFWVVTGYGLFEFYFPFSTFLDQHTFTSAEVGIFYRLNAGIAILAFVLMFNRSWKRYLRVPRGRNQWIVSLSILAFYLLAHAKDIKSTKFSVTEILVGLLFVFGVGFMEELTSRFLILSTLNAYLGLWGALILSSINFGMMHIGNFFAGGQGMQETAIQAIGAAAVGFMLASLLIYTRSIWIPILVHATIDLSLGLGTAPAHATHSTGGIKGHGIGWADWAGLGFDLFLNVGMGLLMLRAARVLHASKRPERMMEFFGLVEKPADKAGIKVRM